MPAQPHAPERSPLGRSRCGVHSPSDFATALMRLSSLLVLLLISAVPLRAQAVGTACPYTTCALRVEPALFTAHVVRGTEGERVASFGLFGTRPPLPQLVAGSGPAVAQAHVFERKSTQAGWLQLSGAALVVLPVFTENALSDGLRLASSVAGLGLTLWRTITAADAQCAVSRALW